MSAAKGIGEVTQLLDAVGRGDERAHDRLWELIYDELRTMAGRQMASEAKDRTLQPTALVHEAYFRLIGNQGIQWNGRRHFLSAAAKAMRRIRIDHARKRKSLKRGGGRRPSDVECAQPGFDDNPTQVLAIDEALNRLERKDPRKAQIVTLRFFAGLTIEETAEALDLSTRAVNNEWRLARAWLHRELSKGDTAIVGPAAAD